MLQANKLKYQIKYTQEQQQVGARGFNICFENPFFTKCVNVTTLNKFLEGRLTQYQYQCHTKYISFQCCGSQIAISDIESFIEQIDGILSQIMVSRLKKRQKNIENNYSIMLKLFNFSCCCGFKIVKKRVQDYQVGEFILFYYQEEKKQIQKLICCIEGFRTDIVNYPLSSQLGKYRIPENIVRRVFEQLINNYADQIISLGVYYQLNIFNMGICRRAPHTQQKQWFLSLYIEGMISNALEHTMESIPLHIVKIKSINSAKMTQIQSQFRYTDNVKMVSGNQLLIMNRQFTNRDIDNLALGYYFIGENKLNDQDRSILSIEVNNDRLKKYIEERQLGIGQLLVYEQFIIIKIRKQLLENAIYQLKKYLKKFQLIKTQCHQFKDRMLKNVFYNYYRNRIQKKIYIKFTLANGQLWRENYSVDEQKILTLLQIIKQQLIRQFVVIPSLVPVSNYYSKVNQFDGLFQMEKNPQCFWEKNSKSVMYQLPNQKTKLVLRQFGNLVELEQQVVFVVHNNQSIVNSKVWSFAQENKINIREFMDGTEGMKSCRVKKFRTKDSIRFRYITLLYFDIKKINLRHIDQDLSNCLKSLQSQKKLNIVLFQSSKKFFQQLFPRVIQKINSMLQHQQIIVQIINIYYQNINLLSIIERVIGNSRIQFSLITYELLDKWAILKINNLREYVLSYYWKQHTYELPGLDSFICHYRKNKSTMGRFLLTIPPIDYLEQQYNQFLVDFRLQKVYRVQNFFSIEEYPMKQMSQQFQNFFYCITNQFAQMQYIVVYAKMRNKQIGRQICMNIFYSNDKKKGLIPLNINLRNWSISQRNQSNLIPFVINRKQYVDWFKIVTHRKCLGVLEKCFEK